MTADPRKRDYGSEGWPRSYQLKLLRLCMADPSFLRAYRDIVRPEYFADPALGDLFRAALDFYNKHGLPPTQDALEFSITRRTRTKRTSPKEHLLNALAEAAETRLDDAPAVKEAAAEFSKTQAAIAAVYAAIDDLGKGDTSKLVARFSDALAIGAAREDLGASFYDAAAHYAARREEAAVPTGIASLDEIIHGLAPGELGIVEAPTGRFKSGVLINFAGHALSSCGCDVAHATLELSKEVTLRRYGGAVLGFQHAYSTSPELQKELDEFWEKTRRNLHVRFWPHSSATVGDIRAWLHALADAGIIAPKERPLLIIVDYGMILKPSTRRSEKREEHRENYQGLIGLAAEFGAPVWSAMQSNRNSVGKKLIGIEDLAECFAVAADASLIVSLNQTKEEARENRMRMFTAKVRDARSFDVMDLQVDYNTFKIFDNGRADDEDLEPEAKKAMDGARRRTRA